MLCGFVRPTTLGKVMCHGVAWSEHVVFIVKLNSNRQGGVGLCKVRHCVFGCVVSVSSAV